MDTIDFGPTTREVARVLRAIPDDRLGSRTPCPAYAVGDLAEHVGGLTREFTYAARKEPTPGVQADGDADRLEPGWRERVVADLADLARAWEQPTAYDGETHAGPVTLPATEAALVALNELVVHGWDLAVSTGQDYAPDPTAVVTCTDFVAGFEAPANDDGGLFGPPVAVADDAPALDRLVGLTGRDPAGRP